MGAQIDHLTPAELVMMDTKIFKLGGKKVRVSVLETTKPAMPLKKKAEMVEAQKKLVKEEGLDDMLLFVVDIIKEEATFVSCSPTASKMVEKRGRPQSTRTVWLSSLAFCHAKSK